MPVLSWLLLLPSICSFSPLRTTGTASQRLHPVSCSSSPSKKLSQTRLYSSSTDSISGSTSTSSTSDTNKAQTSSAPTQKESKQLDMPWSDIQQWALKDNLPKFTVMIPSSTGTSKQYAMWRALTREAPELAGYPIPFLVQMHQRSLSQEDRLTTPGVLPMVDDFEFASNGGITGRAYGLPGIADGTRINTPPLIGVETTVPLGYVTTANDKDEEGVGFSYELGTCASSSVYSLDGSERSAALLSARRLMMEGMDAGVSSSRQVASIAKDAVVTGSGLLSDSEANQDLVYLGGATAMLLASATAIGMLSHHLTVNVFWV